MYSFRTSAGPVDLAFTNRHGGVSHAPFDTLNLALGGEDSAAARDQNHRRVLNDFGPGDQLVDLDQIHGARVVTVGAEGHPGRHEADAMVTVNRGKLLMVRSADCVPVLMADSERPLIAAVHCGRLGLTAKVVPATVHRMRDLGAEAITAWVGPHICGGCYEVPQDMQETVGAVEPNSVCTTSWGTPALDIGAGVVAQLERNGVRVVLAAPCTRESTDLFSHRRDGRAAGRQAGLIRIRP